MRIGFISLGCAKNRVNCEQMMYLLQQAGYQVTGELEHIDLVVINTCGFIDAAKSEAIDNILMAGELKTQGKIGKILVTGCLAQRYQQEILEQMPEVDGILGTGSYYDIVHGVKAVLAGKGFAQFGSIDGPVEESRRILTTPAHYAYLKIAEGCDNHCAYCVIPSLRGRYRSRKLEDCVAEARELAENGVRELIVVAQDTSRYGIDLYQKRMLPQLLRQLAQIDQLHWIRVHYCYPDEITDELIQVMAQEKKIVKYLDIPIQHVNDEILRKMHRRGNKAYLEELFPRLRREIPGLVIRTSLIAGLPGEGEAEFAELCDFLRRHKLERAGAFAFSPEEGTPAAAMDYPPTELAQARAKQIGELQAEILDAHNQSLLGKTLEVLCDGTEGAEYVGRTYADSPDVDGVVYFTAQRPVTPGMFVQVQITGERDGDLLGKQIGGCKNDNGK